MDIRHYDNENAGKDQVLIRTKWIAFSRDPGILCKEETLKSAGRHGNTQASHIWDKEYHEDKYHGDTEHEVSLIRVNIDGPDAPVVVRGLLEP